MGKIKKLRTALSAVLAGTMLIGTASAFPTRAPLSAEAAGACTINTNKEYQTIRGFGGMNHPEWQSYNAQNGAPGDMTEAQVQKAFGNGADELGLTILRIFVSDDKNAWKNAIPTAQRAQKLGATVFATPWNPPASMRTNGTGGPTGGQYVLKQGAEAQYAQHLNDFIKYCNSQGVELNSISVQNEPDWSGEWTAWTADRAANFIANYGKSVTAGTTTKLMSPESFSYNKSFYNAILNNSKAMANCDMFGTHFYGTQRSQMDFPALEQCGKEIWMTEVYVPNSDNNSADRWPEGVQVAENIHNALVVGNMNAYVWWYIRRQYSPMWDTGKISKRGYAMAQFSKWVRPGDVRIDATEQPNTNILVSAYKHSDTQATVVAINKGSGAVSQQFTLSGRNVTGVETYRTSGSENIASISGVSASGSSFTAQLPANSVSTFVVALESDGKGFVGGKDPTPPEPIEPDANGYYYHDTFEDDSNGWEGRGGATVTTGGSAYAGSKALTVSGRTSAWHGAMKTLDYLTFKAGESYSFSVAAKGSGNMMLSLEYTADGETKYDHIADGVSSGEYVQLANANYTIPTGASNIKLYVETEEGTDDFAIDEAIVAKAGTVIDGPKAVVTTTTTTAPVVTTETTTNPPAPAQDLKEVLNSKVSKWGDANNDGGVDMADVVLIMQSLANPDKYKLTETGSFNADVSEAGGGITANDALAIQKYLLGTINKLPESYSDDIKTVTTAATTTKATTTTTTTTSADPSAYMASIRDQITVNVPSTVLKNAEGTVEHITYFSKKANRNKGANVWLPPGYDSSKKYPVFYVNHGYGGDESSMMNGMGIREIATNLIKSGEAEPMIIVFTNQYTDPNHEKQTGNGQADVPGYDNFVEDMPDSLMPYIESHYPVKTGRENTAVAGFSMGGRESLYIGMKCCDKVGYIGGGAPAPGIFPTQDQFMTHPGVMSKDDMRIDPPYSPYLLMIAGGTNDTMVNDFPKQYSDLFTQHGTENIYISVPGGGHDANTVIPLMYNFIKFIFKA